MGACMPELVLISDPLRLLAQSDMEVDDFVHWIRRIEDDALEVLQIAENEFGVRVEPVVEFRVQRR